MTSNPDESNTGHAYAMLFVPAFPADRLAKAARFAPTPCIIDLEDSVARSEKLSAREAARHYLEGAGDEERLWVRVNPTAGSLGHDDIAAIVTPALRGVLLPKVESAAALREVDEALSTYELKGGLLRGGIRLMAAIETMAGLAAAREIAAATPRLSQLSFGAGDLTLDLGLEWPEEGEWNHAIAAARVELVFASRLGGLLPPDDGSYPAYRDLDGLRREARWSKRMGFGGKHAIHPSQIPIIEEVFAPSERQIERARKIIETFTAAEETGSAAIGLDGELIDYPVVQRARRLLGLEE